MNLVELSKNVTDIKSWLPIIEPYLSKLDKEDYECLSNELYELVYGEVLSVEKAKCLVNKMKPYGEHWKIEETNTLISNSYKKATNYYVLNMMYNDYYEVFQDDTNMYIKMAYCWLNDEDNIDGDSKTYRYAIKV